MTAFSSWSLPRIDIETAVALHAFMPFIVGFLVSRWIYGQVNKAGLQSAGFSPTVASILTAPLLACAYYYMLLLGLAGYSRIRLILYQMGFVLVCFGPIILPLSPLLVIYLRGGFRRKEIYGVMLCVAAVALVILEFLGLYLTLCAM
jgi:hypothetical protein